MSVTKMNRLVAAVLLLAVVPVAGAWNLVSKINADARQMPGAPSTVVVASGAASAHLSGMTLYPGRVFCAGSNTCLFGPVSYSLLTNGARTITPMGCSYWGRNCWGTVDTNVAVTVGMTWDEAISAWVRRHGSSVTRSYGYIYSIEAGWTAQICAAWGTYGVTGFMRVVPGTDSCVPPPIPPNQCNVSGGAVDLDHDQLNTGAITGARREVARQVTCRSRASIRYQVSAGNPVILGNGIESLITVNGVRAGQLITLPAGSSTLRIASTLTDKGAQTGVFSKTVVLIQSFM